MSKSSRYLWIVWWLLSVVICTAGALPPIWLWYFDTSSTSASSCQMYVYLSMLISSRLFHKKCVLAPIYSTASSDKKLFKQQLVRFLCVFYAEVYFQISIFLWRKGQTDKKCLSSGSKGYICSWANQPLDLIWLENPKLGAKVDKILKQQWRSMLGWMASRKSRQTTEPAASQRNDRTRKKRRVCLQLSAILGIVRQ